MSTIKKKSHMFSVKKQTDKETHEVKERKVFYYQEDKEKPILAAGMIFFRELPNNKKEILVQNEPNKEKGFIYSDFGGKIDMEDKTVIAAVAREAGEETNYGIFKKTKNGNVFLDNEGIKKYIQTNITESFYMPVAKYFMVMVHFNESAIGLDMEKIGDFEHLDKIQRKVEWIPGDTFINAHFEGHVHPRLWSKEILHFLGYEGHYQNPNQPKPPKKFAFSSAK